MFSEIMSDALETANCSFLGITFISENISRYFLIAVSIVKTPHNVLGHNLQQCHECKNKTANRKKLTTNTNYVAPLILLSRTDFERFIMNSLFKRECY